MPSNYRRRNRRNPWVGVLVSIVGLFLGGYLGYFLSTQWPAYFGWAGTALEIGTEVPWQIASALVDASILLKVRFNLFSVLGLVLFYLIYRLVRR